MFPGLEWSCSTAEAGKCIAIRVYPGRKAAALGKQMALSLFPLTSTGWAQTPRWEKALMMLTGRAPRAITLHSIQRALSYLPGSPAHEASTRAAL